MQAALFSLYAAPAAVAVRYYAQTTAAPSVARHVEWVSLGLMVVGLLLGIAAVLARLWTGRRRVLGRAVVGVALNAAALATIRYTASVHPDPGPLGPVGPDPARLVGTWWRRYLDNGTVVTNTVALAADGSLHETYTSEYGLFGDWTGRWSVEDGQLVLDLDPADMKVGRPGHHHFRGPTGVVRVPSSPVPALWQLWVGPAETGRHFFRKVDPPAAGGHTAAAAAP